MVRGCGYALLLLLLLAGGGALLGELGSTGEEIGQWIGWGLGGLALLVYVIVVRLRR